MAASSVMQKKLKSCIFVFLSSSPNNWNSTYFMCLKLLLLFFTYKNALLSDLILLEKFKPKL